MSKNETMIGRNFLLLTGLILILSACTPALDRGYLREGERRVSFAALRKNPDQYRDRLFVFGGVIVETRLTKEGALIEAMHVPVDRYGYFQDRGRSEGRFLALMPKDRTILDPEVYRKGRRITVAGRFMEPRKSMIGEMEYLYPVFQIEQIHLWPRERSYYPAYYYDYYDPWFYPYPYYYSDPWWRYPYYYNYYDYRRTPPPYRRSRPPDRPPTSRQLQPPSDQSRDPGSREAPGLPAPAPQRELQRR